MRPRWQRQNRSEPIRRSPARARPVRFLTSRRLSHRPSQGPSHHSSSRRCPSRQQGCSRPRRRGRRRQNPLLRRSARPPSSGRAPRRTSRIRQSRLLARPPPSAPAAWPRHRRGSRSARSRSCLSLTRRCPGSTRHQDRRSRPWCCWMPDRALASRFRRASRCPRSRTCRPARAATSQLGPIIQGVYCKNGHFDDPEALFCAICGISMNQQTLVPRPGERPPLGVLLLDDGSVFQLDSDYVVGREPSLDGSVAAGKARPLRVADDVGHRVPGARAGPPGRLAGARHRPRLSERHPRAAARPACRSAAGAAGADRARHRQPGRPRRPRVPLRVPPRPLTAGRPER